MNAKRRAALAALALVLSAHLHAAGESAAGHDHHGDVGAITQLQLNAGEQWATDKPLRQAMDDINQAMAKALPLIHGDKFDDGAYRALATTINQKVAYAVERCKLEPKADAMLHLVLAELIAGAETMDGKTAGPRHDGAVRVQNSLHAYGEYFQHPGWNPPMD